MSTLKTDAIEAATGTNTNLALTGKGTGKVAIGDAALLFPDADGSSSGDVLQTNASGVLSFATPAAGGAWTLINTAVASTSATLEITGLSSTYDTYAIAFSDIVPVTDNDTGQVQLGDSSGIDTGGSDYGYHCAKVTDSSGSYASNTSTGNNSIQCGGAVGNAAGEGMSALLFLGEPGDGTTLPKIFGNYLCHDNSTLATGGYVLGTRKAVITVDRIRFSFASGNIASGRMTVWGISHA